MIFIKFERMKYRFDHVSSDKARQSSVYQACIVSLRVVSFSILAYSYSFRLVRELVRFVSF